MKLLENIRTDSSGKWVNIDDVNQTVNMVLHECLNIVSDRKNYNTHVCTSFDASLADAVAADIKKTIKARFELI